MLTASEICQLLRVCGDVGVVDLSLGELRVIFKGDCSKKEIETEISAEQQEVVTVEMTERDEIALRDEQLSQMEIEDPAGFERLLLAGDLVNSKVGDKPDEGHSGAE